MIPDPRMNQRVRSFVLLLAFSGVLPLITGCSAEPETEARNHGDLTSDLHRQGSSSDNAAAFSPKKNSTGFDATTQSTGSSGEDVADQQAAENDNASLSARGKSNEEKPDDTGDDKQPANESAFPEPRAEEQPESAPPLTVHVVNSEAAGDLDIYVVNATGANITNCTMLLFNEFEMDVSPLMKPGQAGICALGGEIPKSVVFKSDQFDAFEFLLPEKPLDEIDISQFDWAATPQSEPDSDSGSDN